MASQPEAGVALANPVPPGAPTAPHPASPRRAPPPFPAGRARPGEHGGCGGRGPVPPGEQQVCREDRRGELDPRGQADRRALPPGGTGQRQVVQHCRGQDEVHLAVAGPAGPPRPGSRRARYSMTGKATALAAVSKTTVASRGMAASTVSTTAANGGEGDPNTPAPSRRTGRPTPHGR